MSFFKIIWPIIWVKIWPTLFLNKVENLIKSMEQILRNRTSTRCRENRRMKAVEGQGRKEGGAGRSGPRKGWDQTVTEDELGFAEGSFARTLKVVTGQTFLLPLVAASLHWACGPARRWRRAPVTLFLPQAPADGKDVKPSPVPPLKCLMVKLHCFS